MPLQRCDPDNKNGWTGWKWGKNGKCYRTKQKALRQMRAIFASGWGGK